MMEQSTGKFHIFLCLDSFHSNVHNVTKDSSELEAWLTFLSATDPLVIGALIEAFPCFAPIYQEIMEFAKDPKELIGMLSKELYIMDKNMERLMVSQLQEEVTAAKAERDKVVAERDEAVAKVHEAEAERDIFKLHCKGKRPEEISNELKLSIDYVISILNNN